MLEIKVTGDTHPKTFTVVIDDRNAELDRLQTIIHDEIGAPPDDDLRAWFDKTTADEFAEGVVIPTEIVGDFGEILEGDWWEEAEKIDAQRRDAVAAAERAAGG